MRKEIISSLVCMLMIASALPVMAAGIRPAGTGDAVASQSPQTQGRGGWTLQWSHDYGGQGHAQMAKVVGDLDGDGVNEVVIGGYEDQGHLRIISYVGGTYQEEYSYSPPGGYYNCPSGATIEDFNGDGVLELIVSWAYTDNDGVYAYHWDGTTMTELDEYHGVGVDFLYDVNSCDYNGDGTPEVVLCNAPNTGGYAITGLQFINNHFVYQASWTCPNGYSECPMCASGDIDNDGALEIAASVSNDGTWSLSWNGNGWDSVPIWTDYGAGASYGIGVADINGDGTPEIGTGMRYTPTGYLFEWDGSSFQKVWERTMPGGAEDIIESVALGDADNDGHNEMCIGGGPTHIIGWDGTQYVFEANLTQSTGREAGMNIGDMDSDGTNELKACEILSSTGYEYIFKCDNTPPETTIHLNGTLDGDIYISPVSVTFTTDGPVASTYYALDSTNYQLYAAPFVVSSNGSHTISYYSVDSTGNQETPKSVTFTISLHPIMTIDLKGGMGITMTIKNICNVLEVSHQPWSLSINNGMILLGGGTKTGFMDLAPGVSMTEKLFAVGFGKITVTAVAGQYTQQTHATLFLCFVVGLK